MRYATAWSGRKSSSTGGSTAGGNGTRRCDACRLACTGRQTGAGYRYYLCRGRTDPVRAAQGQRCTARYIPAGQLDELVWADLCTLLTDPGQVTHALARAQAGAWLPQELQARQATIRQALSRLERVS